MKRVPLLRSGLALALLAGACAGRNAGHAPAPAAAHRFSAPARPSSVAAHAPSDPAHARAAGLVRWVDAAHADAALWLARQPPGPALDAALVSLATHPDVLVPCPAFAAEQADRVADAGLRLAALAEVVSTWARLDPDAARLRVTRLDRIDDLERTHLHEQLADAAALP